MVNSKDLRLGNLVRIDLEDENDDLTPYLNNVVKVCSVDEYSIKTRIQDKEILIKWNFGQGIKPILLNEQIFESIQGMEHISADPHRHTGEQHNIGEFRFCLNARNKEYELYTIFSNIRAKTLKYLHELQNVYFALTGEELKIDIEKLNQIIW